MNPSLLPIATALALMLGGCQTMFDLVGVEQPLSAGEARKFDGSYQGTISQIPHAQPGCPFERGEKVIMIGDGVLWYAYSPTALFTAPVRYDGLIEAASGSATLVGKINDDHLELTIAAPACITRISMNYIENHS